MPLYDYQCTSPACGHSFEEYNHMNQCALQECKKCGGPCRIVLNKPPAVPRDWEGREATSMVMAFAPGSEKKLKEELGVDVPLDHTGAVVFKNDRQQRRLYKAIDSKLKEYDEIETERRDRQVVDAEEIGNAAAAIGRLQAATGQTQ